MEYIILGKTGLQVSVLGLGGRGHSRLGQRTGISEDQSIALVRRALELGVPFIDTAESYGTEAIIKDVSFALRRSPILFHAPEQVRIVQHDTVFVKRKLRPEATAVEVLEEIDLVGQPRIGLWLRANR
jgi:diketogulonate reductase-like aldo/keto reductase